MKQLTKKQLDKLEAKIKDYGNQALQHFDAQTVAVKIWNRFGYLSCVNKDGRVCFKSHNGLVVL